MSYVLCMIRYYTERTIFAEIFTNLLDTKMKIIL